MDGSGNSRRRRGPGVVTPNACTECRKKRAKCDGQIPCGRCAVHNHVDCIYEVPVRHTKEHLRAEIEQLRTVQRQSDRLLAALVSNDTSVQVLDQLRNGETVEEIARKLDGSNTTTPASGSGITSFARFSDQQEVMGVLSHARSVESSPLSNIAFSDSNIQHEASALSGARLLDQGQDQHVMDWKHESKQDLNQVPSQGSYSGLSIPLLGMYDDRLGTRSPPPLTTSQSRGDGQDAILGPKGEKYIRNNPSQWTNVTTNEALVDHLMALYFCWEYPTFASLSKEHFLEDFRGGVARYCSSLLVNAILALGCRLSNLVEARSIPTDKHTAGDHFFAEALRLLQLDEDKHVLTTIQALGLMSLREASCGRSSNAIFFSGQSIRLAIELSLHRDTQDDSSSEAKKDHEVRSATFWGAFSLDQAWSLSIGRLPHFSRDLSVINKPAIIDHIEKSSWVPYTDDGAPLERPCTQPSNVRSVFKSFCELSEIIHRSLYTLYSPGALVTSKSLLSIYTDYLHWYESLTPVLKLGQNFTPAVLFAHMHYHFAILLLFRPFMKLDIVGSSVTPRDVCAQASDAISAVVNSYTQLYGLRRTPTFVPYFVLTSSITHLVTLGNSRAGAEFVRQGLADLKELSGCHAFADRALEILRFLTRHWNVQGLDTDEEQDIDVKTLCRPRSQSLNQFCPNLSSSEILSGIGPPKPDESPLFWPFPLQGRPLLDVKMLLDSGFALMAP